MRTSSASVRVRIFCIRLRLWTLAMISPMPIASAICLFSRPPMASAPVPLGHILGEQFGVRFTVQVDGQRRPLCRDVAQEACFIAREALQNAFRHAGGGRSACICILVVTGMLRFAAA